MRSCQTKWPFWRSLLMVYSSTIKYLKPKHFKRWLTSTALNIIYTQYLIWYNNKVYQHKQYKMRDYILVYVFILYLILGMNIKINTFWIHCRDHTDQWRRKRIIVAHFFSFRQFFPNMAFPSGITSFSRILASDTSEVCESGATEAQLEESYFF